jgi:hypothetical protein
MTEAKYGSRTGAMKLPIWHARVKGLGDFPLDMLRYDGAWPRTEMDTGVIAATMYGRGGPRLSREERDNLVVEITGTSPGGPSCRWPSFMWRVVDWEWQAK